MKVTCPSCMTEFEVSSNLKKRDLIQKLPFSENVMRLDKKALDEIVKKFNECRGNAPVADTAKDVSQ